MLHPNGSQGTDRGRPDAGSSSGPPTVAGSSRGRARGSRRRRRRRRRRQRHLVLHRHLGNERHHDHASLIGAVIIFSLLSFGIGLWLSRKVLKPVTELARRLRDFRKTGKVEPLAEHFADDEVGELAHALDDYSERLTAMVERDREFNSDVSHELRTPLAVIASTTELLQGSPDLTDKINERLNRIERASRQATELIEALLLLSRAERRGPTRGEITEVGKVSTDVIESQRPQMRGKPLTIELDIREPVNINAPASVLSVALTNLIGNAIKYTLEGSGSVAVRIKPEDAERLFQRGVRASQPVIALSVADTGIGDRADKTCMAGSCRCARGPTPTVRSPASFSTEPATFRAA
ncbi:MAG: hypothetical protein WDW38_005516 [Sanguina aurantia]